MTLPSSGPLSLADIQGEFGGSNPISLSEYYAGGAYVPAGTTGTYGAVPTAGNPISIRNFYGTSAIRDTQTVTVGFAGAPYASIYGFKSGSCGSVSDGTFNPKSGAAISELSCVVSYTNTVQFSLTGTYTNDGWTTMTIDGTPYTRASASFSNSGGSTVWTWSTGTNPFGTTVGATKTVVFT
jgi:hypothetical protein